MRDSKKCGCNGKNTKKKTRRNFGIETQSPEGQAEAAAKPAAGAKPYSYEPVVWHWFYLKEVDKKSSWKPFSMLDSVSLEETYQLRESAILFPIFPSPALPT